MCSPGLVNSSEISNRDTSPADDCNYNKQELCGDVCIDIGKRCSCGDGQEFAFGEEKYCCLEEKLPGKQCYIGGTYRDGYCDSGRTLYHWQLCNDQCYNEYTGNNTSLGSYARYKCKTDYSCAQVDDMCHGVAVCWDESDIKACNSHLQCISSDEEVTKYDIHSTIVVQHSECGYHYLDNNGAYDTITRRDETNLNVVTQTASNIDYTTLQNCTDKDGLQGLTCDSAADGCHLNPFWCTNDLFGTCNNSSFDLNDKSLCNNATFWRRQSCLQSNRHGITLAVGQRCNGQVQSCYYMWYTTVNYFYEVCRLNDFTNIKRNSFYFYFSFLSGCEKLSRYENKM